MTALFRPVRAILGACLALAIVTGCAVNHSDNFVSLVGTTEVAPRPALLANADIVVVGGQFGPITTKGNAAPEFEMIANRQLATLLPALRAQLPAVLRRNGIPAQLAAAGRPPADQVITIKPQMATSQLDNGYSYKNGNWVGVKLSIEIRQRSGELLWRGTALERASPSRAESMQWSDDMAEDMARTLLIRLRREGVVKLGANGDADPV